MPMTSFEPMITTTQLADITGRHISNWQILEAVERMFPQSQLARTTFKTAAGIEMACYVLDEEQAMMFADRRFTPKLISKVKEFFIDLDEEYDDEGCEDLI